ncbi:MAG TPA: septum formation initiator family protein [Aggregatilineales bacterium]|nr:hypothetical protein [Chloroflexota bacterium]HOA22810.1 septum formation initiator family protein [Aggregatilineales bacterium]HPV05899.1 septum formation initiator family protein [Aggregatilineales bacterium]HQA69431.1 septum formation initiator family protein [Aggregatilineales bacterium]
MADSPDVQDATRADRGFRFRRMRLTNWQIILIALVIFGGRLVFDFSERIIDGQQKVDEQRRLEAEIEALLEEQRRLEAEKAYYSSPAYVEAWAHSEGKMVRDGEVLVVPLYERPTPEPLVAIAPQQQPQSDQPFSSWRVWWSLFFDDPPPFAKAR